MKDISQQSLQELEDEGYFIVIISPDNVPQHENFDSGIAEDAMLYAFDHYTQNLEDLNK